MSKRWDEGLRWPLAGDVAGFGAELVRLGYSRSAAKKQLSLVARLSVWLDHGGLEVRDVRTGLVEPFFEVRRETRRVSPICARGGHWCLWSDIWVGSAGSASSTRCSRPARLR